MSKFGDFSDYDSYTESSDSEDHESESTYGGNAQSILSSLDDSIEKIDDFLTYERGFVHGDVVCSITDQSGQLGKVINVDMSVDLESQFGVVNKDVNSKFLRKIQPISFNDYIVRGSWLGRVKKVHHLVTVLFNDGAKCELLAGNSEIITPISSRLFEEAPYPYYTGQRVKISLPSIPKPVKWLCGSSKSIQNEGTICKVDVGLVHVNWIASVVTTSSSIPPHHIQSLENITLLSCFSCANWQLGDWCTLLNEGHSPPYDKNCDYTYIVTRTKSKVDVMWQNGKVSVGLDAQTLLPVNSVGDHDFWPGQFVLEKVTLDDLDSVRAPPRLGIVEVVDSKDRTIEVSWKIKEGESRVETVSAYELIEHPDFSFCIGDIVFRTFTESNDIYRVDDEGKEKVQACEGHFGDSLNYYLSYIGSVIGFKDGGIEVKWANGLSSKVHPSEIFGIERNGDTASISIAPAESVPESTSNHAAEKAMNYSAEPYMNDVGAISSFLLPCTSIGYLKSIATSVFSLWKGVPGFQALEMEEPSVEDNNVEEESLDKRVKEADIGKKLLQLPVNEKLGLLKQFDIVDDFADHHFANDVSSWDLHRSNPCFVEDIFFDSV